MKTRILVIAAFFSGLGLACAAEKIKAPNGGRIVEGLNPAAEFLVTPDRKIELRFLDESGKVLPPAKQVVTVTTGERSHPVRLVFTKEGDKLVSDKPIPQGDHLPIVLQVRTQEGQKAANDKFTLNMAICPDCKLAEYACRCSHDDAHSH